jgi:hypothetical protein
LAGQEFDHRDKAPSNHLGARRLSSSQKDFSVIAQFINQRESIVMNLSVSGLPALIVQVGFVVVFSAPVWLAAKLIGAQHPTLLRAALSLIVGVVGSVVSIAAGGGWALLLVPTAFLLAFKFILGTSLIGAIGIAIIAVIGYAAMVHFIGSGFAVSGGGVTVRKSVGAMVVVAPTNEGGRSMVRISRFRFTSAHIAQYHYLVRARQFRFGGDSA